MGYPSLNGRKAITIAAFESGIYSMECVPPSVTLCYFALLRYLERDASEQVPRQGKKIPGHSARVLNANVDIAQYLITLCSAIQR